MKYERPERCRYSSTARVFKEAIIPKSFGERVSWRYRCFRLNQSLENKMKLQPKTKKTQKALVRRYRRDVDSAIMSNLILGIWVMTKGSFQAILLSAIHIPGMIKVICIKPSPKVASRPFSRSPSIYCVSAPWPRIVSVHHLYHLPGNVPPEDCYQ